MIDKKDTSIQYGYEYAHMLTVFFEGDDKIKVIDWNPKTNTIIIEVTDPAKFHMLNLGIIKDVTFKGCPLNVEVKYTGLSDLDGLTEEEYDLLLKGNPHYEGLIAAETETVSLVKSVVFKEEVFHYGDGNFFDPWCAGHTLWQEVAKQIFKKKVPFSTMINFDKKEK